MIEIFLSTKLLCVASTCYAIAIGKPQTPTPRGIYQVTRKVINPAWINPYTPSIRIASGDANNPLGTRAIALDKFDIVIHGTNQKQSIGKAVSHGCIRMNNSDIEEIFESIPIGGQVLIK